MKNTDMIIDLQYGSTGKGLAASVLAERIGYDCVISANMPNAGHTAYDQHGEKFVHKVLPSGVFYRDDLHRRMDRFIMVGPGAVFSPEQLYKEYDALEKAGHLIGAKILIHSAAVPLTPEMVKEEQNSPVKAIASTLQGSMVAQMAKMHRNPTQKVIARDAFIPKRDRINVVGHMEWMYITQHARNVLAEGSQGYSLGINQGFYPYTTSRDCTPARFLSDMGLPHNCLRYVLGVARTFPIRVGNVAEGDSGGHYPDQRELSWEEVGQVPETTTVTRRVRRVFTMSNAQIYEACMACQPDRIFLNFANYLPRGEVTVMVKKIQDSTGRKVTYLGYGPQAKDVEVLK